MTATDPIAPKIERVLKSLMAVYALAGALIGAIIFAANIYIDWRDYMNRFENALTRIEALETRLDARAGEIDASPIVAFPGARHQVHGAAPGLSGLVEWSPIRKFRKDCHPEKLHAFVRDREGVTHPSRIHLPAAINLPMGDSDLAYLFDIPEQAASGSAHLTVQVTYRCPGGHIQTHQSPPVSFQIYAPIEGLEP